MRRITRVEPSAFQATARLCFTIPTLRKDRYRLVTKSGSGFGRRTPFASRWKNSYGPKATSTVRSLQSHGLTPRKNSLRSLCNLPLSPRYLFLGPENSGPLVFLLRLVLQLGTPLKLYLVPNTWYVFWYNMSSTTVKRSFVSLYFLAARSSRCG